MKNNTFYEIWNEINNYHKITILTHVNADGDTIGTAIALKHLILLNTKIKEVKISGEAYPRYLNFLEKNDHISDEFFNDSLKIVVDTSTKSRIHDKRVDPTKTIKIDHHPHEGKWLLAIGGDHWPATGQIIYEMIKELGLKINKQVKEAVFISIWTDTEGMIQRNINKITHQAINEYGNFKKAILKKMALTNGEKSLIKTAKINKLQNVTYGISEKVIPNDIYRQYVAYIYNQTTTEVIIVGARQKDHYRFGIRSRGNIDVSIYAKKMGGGGHFSSSGFMIKSNEKQVKIRIHELIKEINNERNNK